MRVEAKNLRFGYGKEQSTLNDISFSVDASKTLAIVGSSGCGKSTLLRVLCGLLPNLPSQCFSGQVLIDNVDVAANKPAWRGLRSKGALGFMFQESCLLPNMTVEENIHLPLQILGQSSDGERLVSDYLKITGLEAAKEKLPNQLSGGMKTRAALARTFISGPKLLLLDEPFSALDIVWKARLYKELVKLRGELQSTVILVTHDIFEALFFSDRVLVMGNGHSIAEEVTIEGWQNSHSYNDVVNKHHNDFVRIKNLIESSQGSGT